MIHNYSTLRLYSSRKNLPLFDTSTSHKKKKSWKNNSFYKILCFFIHVPLLYGASVNDDS